MGEKRLWRETWQMIRVHVICEGQTEEMFVTELLAGQFQSKGVYLMPSLIGKPGHKGGNVRFDRLRIDVRNRLLGDKTACCTTFFDFYGLPADFPGKTAALGLPSIEEKAQCVRMAMTKELELFLNPSEGIRRFIPYVQMYEFESLLFSSPDSLAHGISCPNRPCISKRFAIYSTRQSRSTIIRQQRRVSGLKRLLQVMKNPYMERLQHWRLVLML
jgi:hypothetical protein